MRANSIRMPRIRSKPATTSPPNRIYWRPACSCANSTS